MKTFIKRMSALFAVTCIVLFSFPSVNAYAALVSEGEVTWDALMEYQEDYFAILDKKLLDYQGEGNYYIGHIVLRNSHTSGSIEEQEIHYYSFIIEGGKENFENYVFGFPFNDNSCWFVSKGPLIYITSHYGNSEYYQDLNNRLKGFQNATVDTGTVDYNTEDDIKKYYRYMRLNPYYNEKVEIIYSDVDVIDIDASSNYTNNSFDYLYHDDRSRVIYESDLREPEYVYDTSMGFNSDSFSARQYFNNHTWGCQNVKVDFAPSSYSYEKMYQSADQWYLELNMNFNVQLSYRGKSILNPKAHTATDNLHVVLRYPIDSLRSESVIVNIYQILNNPVGEYDRYTILSSDVEQSSYMNLFLNGYYDYYESLAYNDTWFDLLSGSRSLGNEAFDLVSSLTGTVADIFGMDGDLDYSFANFDVEITGILTDGRTRSCPGSAYVNLLTGFNSGFTSDIDDAGNEIAQNGYHSDSNVYKVDNSTGDTYYYDYGDHSVTNVTTPSLNFSDNIALTHTFANTLALHLDNAAELAPTNNIYVYNQGGSGSDNSDPTVIIEDDDYTDSNLIQHMKDGFEILDNTDTEEKGDGLLSAAAFLIAGLPDDYIKMFGFGIASVVTINILRSLFRR